MTEADRKSNEAGRFVGSVFLVPVAFALIVLAVWVVLATLITPGAVGEDAAAQSQRFLRWVLILVGMAFDLVVALLVIWRLARA